MGSYGMILELKPGNSVLYCQDTGWEHFLIMMRIVCV